MASLLNGACLGAGLVFSIQAYVLKYGNVSEIQWLVEVSYLMVLAVMALSAIGQRLVERARINHRLIFDYESPDQHLSWLQMLNFPCVMFFVWSILRTFSRSDVLIAYQAGSLLLLAMPFQALHHPFRTWLIGRLVCLFIAFRIIAPTIGFENANTDQLMHT
jgi:hypothetical protein